MRGAVYNPFGAFGGPLEDPSNDSRFASFYSDTILRHDPSMWKWWGRWWQVLTFLNVNGAAVTVPVNCSALLHQSDSGVAVTEQIRTRYNCLAWYWSVEAS
jgi:hypothetical protein